VDKPLSKPEVVEAGCPDVGYAVHISDDGHSLLQAGYMELAIDPGEARLSLRSQILYVTHDICVHATVLLFRS
jgi:hypothetical protein